MRGRCAYCGADRSIQRHHMTGRADPEGPYLDADLTLPLCVRCHRGDHKSWITGGIEVGESPLVVVARLACTSRGLASRAEPITVPPSAFGALADCLARVVNELGGLS